ncbi:MAG TPA: proline racemase family protein [Steroidobacteraceae bacterium]|nr:proline racemase family protein [Steroidobacteraceae bacterium]
MSRVRAIRVIDSHTGGEPTRVVIEGGPHLGDGPLAQRIAAFRAHEDRFRSAIVNEPRGSDVLVGALLVEPADATCVAGIIFFNNIGFIGMCGHGTIGVVTTLARLGRIGQGEHRLETCAGIVSATLGADGAVTVANVPSYRKARDVECEIPGTGPIRGDVAWGGNWFYLVDDHGQELTLANVEPLTRFAWRLRRALNARGFPEVDHIELFGPAVSREANARNFVLCPGGAYDRSPCGTGTSAKLACLAADGKLDEGQEWIQEGIVGSTFRTTFRRDPQGHIIPIIAGTAHITGEATLLVDERDPFCWGIPSPVTGQLPR